jgi:hypothetical protein
VFNQEDENIFHNFIYRKCLPGWHVFYVSIVFQASNDTMLVPVMSVCMSAGNERNLKFSTSLLFADHDANSKVLEFCLNGFCRYHTQRPDRIFL